MRPAFFEDESIPQLIDFADVYFWGDAFFVAPVTEAGAESVSAIIPPGAWFDFWTDRRYEYSGGVLTEIPVTLETIPVLVRAGSFIPMVDPVDTTEDYSSKELTLHYYADESVTESSGRMYEDDGKTRGNIESGNFELLEFSAQRDGDYLAIDLEHNGSYDGMPDSRRMEIVIHNWTAAVDSVRFKGRKVRGKLRNSTLTVKVDWDHRARHAGRSTKHRRREAGRVPGIHPLVRKHQHDEQAVGHDLTKMASGSSPISQTSPCAALAN